MKKFWLSTIGATGGAAEAAAKLIEISGGKVGLFCNKFI